MLFVKWCMQVIYMRSEECDMIDWGTERTVAFLGYRYRWGSAA